MRWTPVLRGVSWTSRISCHGRAGYKAVALGQTLTRCRLRSLQGGKSLQEKTVLTSVPLLVVSFILYNLGMAGLFGDGPNGDPWQTELFSFRMMSGGVFSMTSGI